MSVMNLVSSGPLLLAIPVAAAAGAVTFLSPCCLPLVPGYLAYITGMSGADATAATVTAPAGAGSEESEAAAGGGVTTRARAKATAASRAAHRPDGRRERRCSSSGSRPCSPLTGGAVGGLGQLFAHDSVLTRILGG
jgi:cytochrome c-type biogenesis protein